MLFGRLVILTFVLTALGSSAAPLWAWGGDGHRVICQLALLEMQPATRERIEQLLADEPANARSFPQACLWADREGRAEPYRTLGGPHYVNVAHGAPGLDLARDCAKGCVVSGIVQFGGELAAAATAPAQRAIALKFLAHFVGDLHQPLHTGYADDRGGNTIAVNFLGRARDAAGERYNLHSVWDSTMLTESGLDGRSWKSRAARLQGKLTPRERRESDSVDLEAWADESFAMLKRDVHVGTPVDRAYYERNLPLLDDRMRSAGLRLARLLDRLLTPGAAAPFFLGSRKGRTYHVPGCPAAAQISPKNLLLWPAAPAGRPQHAGCQRR